MKRQSHFRNLMAPGLDDVAAMAKASFSDLPKTFRALCGPVVFQVSEFPSDEVIEAMGLESPFDILGLFEGIGLAQGGGDYSGAMPNRVFLYRRPILDYWASHDEPLDGIIRHVLIHEIGHHIGLSDADMEAIEAAGD